MAAEIQTQHHTAQSMMLTAEAPASKFKTGNQKCAKCQKILSGHFVRALGTTWHLECFVCIDCEEVVTSKFFPYPVESTTGRHYPLCERDYFRRLKLVCAQCGSALRGSYITALDRKYHIEHFTCSVCPTVFGPDDSYYEHNDKVYCHYHYSIQFAVRCAGCKTAILKQFVEINRHNVDEHWHPECYMINKFWNVKLSLPSVDGRDYFIIGEEWDMTPEQLKEAQVSIEEKVYQIWTVLSAFEESAAACISDMLLHVSNGACIEGVKMAGSFLTHVEVLFTAIDDLYSQYANIKDADLSYSKDAKLLCRKIITFFSLLSHTQETGLRRLGITQELLSLVTGLAHYLKNLIRIALTGALLLEKKYSRKTAISRFLSKLMELASRDRSDFLGSKMLHAEIASDLCVSCKSACEDQCLKYDECRWHLVCFKCSVCKKPLNEEYDTAGFCQWSLTLHCSKCSLSRKDTVSGVVMISQLEQYVYLLRVALQRVFVLLNVNEHIEEGHVAVEPASQMKSKVSAPGALRIDSRSKSYSTGDNPYQAINLGDIKRMKSTHTTRKLSNSNRFGKRSTLMEIPTPAAAAISAKSEPTLQNVDNERDFVYNEEPEQMDHEDFVSKALANMDSVGNSESLMLKDLVSPDLLLMPRSSERGRHSHTDYRKSMAKATAYLAELGALDHFMVKHIAVINIEPFVKDHFSLEDLLELIDDKKASTLWGKFVTGLRTGSNKKATRPKAIGTFGVPLDYLVERNGTESSLGAGPCRIRIPVFVDDCIATLKQMDVSVEGIFRKNGNIRQLKELSDELDRNPSKVNLAAENPIQVAALLKKFLRDLPDSLLTSKLYKLFITSQKLEDPEHRKEVLHLACCLLPKPNRDLMEVLFVFMKWVASYSHFEDNGGSKMDIMNLATVLAPNVIYAKGRDPTREESLLCIEVVHMLLAHHEVFCAVPEELLPFLQDSGLGHSDLSLAAKEVLKKCENLMKLKKSHSTNVVPVDKMYGHTETKEYNTNQVGTDYFSSIPGL
ncbi:hypothetical protein K450DRAFT_218858 [Umbelopsis ramanniana AG]|uniref:Uncharacterized protein n=1 Tax=Umbelopsis ramanniana AG TaxID=1314678 RepID=A0AAD5EI36_UMBRA|nr:uncharacterized protein K450DRAFT_218858 [Umbelopsis ramanniana AG]KAI8584248.1 hypothetical protein K450DRAFT_218858 [Umbelopsis ramanniana AG]